MGAAYAMLISISLLMVLSYIYGMRVYYIPYEIANMVKIVLLGAGLFTCSYFFSEISIFYRVAAKFILVLIFIVMLFLVGIFETVEKQKIKEIAVKLLRLQKK